MLMRQIFTLISCFLFFAITHGQSPNGDISSPFRIRCSADVFPKPLFVVDGVIEDESFLKKLNPSEIESISILKNHEAKAIFSHLAVGGVVIITTKKANQRVIQVKDAETGEKLPFANLELIIAENDKDTSIYLQADSSGDITINKIVNNKEYRLSISHVGYKTFIAHVNSKSIGKEHYVFLEKDHSKLSEVVMVSYGRMIRCRCCGLRIVRIQDSVNEASNTFNKARIYPNPTTRAQKVSVEFYCEKEQELYVKLFSINGGLYSANKFTAVEGLNKLNYTIDTMIAAGLYVLQIMADNNKLIAAGRLIVQ